MRGLGSQESVSTSLSTLRGPRMRALKPQGVLWTGQINRRTATLIHKSTVSPRCKSIWRRRERLTSRVAAQTGQEGRDWKQSLWTAVDLTATLGSVGGAIAFVLTQEAILVGLPVVLPLLALYASRKREKAVLEVCTHIC